MKYPSLLPVTGTIRQVSRFQKDCCTHLVSLTVRGSMVNLIISSDTYVVDAVRLRPGMQITAYYDSNAPVPLIFPPQYRALIVVPRSRQEEVTLQYFDKNLVAADGSLKLNPSPATMITTSNGQSYPCSLGQNTLLVYYRETTRSIPPQTTPRRVIVLC